MRNWLTLMACCTLLTLSSGARADIYTEVNALVQSGQWQSAQALAESRLKTTPTDPQMRLLLSHIQTGQGQTQAAMDTLRALTLSFPELPEPHNNLAALLARDNRHEEALLSLQAAVRARPDYALALENMGDLYLALAARAYGQALNLTPDLKRLQTKQANTHQVLKAP
jgi:tetratricopeptide (TPR) repeat protein